MKIGNGLRFGYYSNSLNFLNLLSFQTTLVIYAKINKMYCPTKENTCFFLSDRLFGCYIDGLIVLLKFSSSSAGISYTPIFVNFTIGHNPFLPKTRRISARQFFSAFSFGILLFMEAVVNAALFGVEEVGDIQVVMNPSPLSPTPPTCLTKTQKSTRLPIAASPNGRLHTFPYFVFVLLGGFYTPAS